MSDPAKTPEEIEDVLASVRRLVSDHAPTRETTAKPVAAEVSPAPSSVPEPVQADALVLTPSFRVTDPEDPWVPVLASETADASEATTTDESGPDAEDLVAELLTADADTTDADTGDTDTVKADTSDADTAAAPPQPGDADWRLDDRLASFDAVGDDADDAAPAPQEWVDDHTDIASEEDIADLIRLDGSDTTLADFESETGDDNWPESGAEAALLTLVARRDPAPEEAAQPTADDPETDDAEVAVEDAVTEAPEVTEEPPHHDEVAAEDAPEDDGAIDENAEDDTEDDHAADLDTPENATPEDITNDDTTIDTPHDETPDFADAIVAETPIEDLGDIPSPFAFPETDEGILDEDTLREIIVEVVREELQGVLGQRITRNVRKMVRREIRLALAAEDLE